MPFNIPSVRIAQASPSVSLEKGSYRMRAPPTRPRPPTTSRLQTRKNAPREHDSPPARGLSVTEFVPASYEKRMALLVACLVCATVGSFWTAYYLWTTR